MGPKLDRVINALQRSLTRTDDKAFGRGMHYPTRWDPYFRDYMTLADVYRYPGQHYDHHRQQLTLVKLTASRLRLDQRGDGDVGDEPANVSFVAVEERAGARRDQHDRRREDRGGGRSA